MIRDRSNLVICLGELKEALIERRDDHSRGVVAVHDALNVRSSAKDRAVNHEARVIDTK
jgi:hypothetical protein